MAEKPGDPASAAPPSEGGVDPSMEDILASIRRILNEDEGQAAPAAAPGFPVQASAAPLPEPEPAPLPIAPPLPEPEAKPDDGVVVLDPSMLVSIPDIAPDPVPVPFPHPVLAPAPLDMADNLLAPAAAAAAASSVGALMRTLAAGRNTAVHRGGPTIEDLVREEMRPLLKEWLDAHLPALVERAVRTEIERVIGQA